MCEKKKEFEKRKVALKLIQKWMAEIKEAEKKEKENEKPE